MTESCATGSPHATAAGPSSMLARLSSSTFEAAFARTTPDALLKSPPFAMPGPHGSREGLASFPIVLGAFILFTAVLLWPCFGHLNSALLGPPEDNMQDFWNTWYTSVRADPFHFFFTNLLRFPEGTPLVYHSFAYPQVFAVAELSRVFGSDLHTLVALQNLTILASFPFAGVGGFYLTHHLTRSSVAGAIGGFIFAFNPSHLAHAFHHAHVSTIEFIPFFVLSYLLALERRSLGWLGSASVLLALSALSCWYYLFYAVYFVVFQLLYQRIRDGAWPRGWNLAAPVSCLLTAGAMLTPLLVPMFMATGPSVYAGGGNTAVADLLAFFAFPPQHMLSSVSRGLYAEFTGYAWEATVYLGFANMAILAWHWFQTGIKRKSLSMYVALGMATFVLLACGEALHVGGIVTFIHLPDVVLDKLPFFANVRTPSRAIVFAYLFMSIGVGAAMDMLWRKPGLAGRAIAILFAILILLDFWPANLEFAPIDRSPGLSLLAADTERGFGVLNLPIGYVEENEYMLEQIYHGRPIMGGNTSRQMTTSLINRLPLTNLAQQRNELVSAHVKFIIIHRPAGKLFAWNAGISPVAEYLRTYQSVYSDDRLTILRVY